MKYFKYLILLISILLLVNIIKFDASISIEAYLEVDKTEIHSGEEVVVSIGLNNVSNISPEENGISLLILELQYDANLFSIPFSKVYKELNIASISDDAKILSDQSIELGLAKDDIVCTVNLDDLNTIQIQIIYGWAQIDTLKTDGEILKLVFTAHENVGGEVEFSINENSACLTDKSNEECIIDNSNANIQVEVISKDVRIDSLYVTSLGSTYYGKYINGYYEVLIPTGTSQIDLHVEPKFALATVSGEGSYSLTNSRGEFTVEVTAQDNITKKSYPVYVRPMKNVKTLSKVEIIGGDFIIDSEKTNVINLDEATSIYNLKTTYAKSISLLFTVKQASGAVVYYNSEQTNIITFNNYFIEEVINLSVVAEDGSTREYTFNITMEEASSDTSLEYVTSNKEVSVTKNDNLYTLNYEYSISNKVRLVIKPSSNATTLKFLSSPLNFTKVNSEYISDEITLTPGSLTVLTVEATSLDNTKEMYTFNLLMSSIDTRSGLENIYINGEKIANFSKNQYKYDLGSIPFNITNLNITVNLESPYSIVTGIGNIELKEGLDVIVITVMSQNPLYGENQNTTYYYLSYSRKKLNHNNNLASLKVNGNLLDLSKTDFNIEFPYANSFIYIEAFLSSDSTGAIISGDIGYRQLDIGINSFKVIVDSEDGQNRKIYTININRLAPSMDTSLKKLEIDYIEIAYANGKYYLEVDYKVNHVHLKAFPNDENASVVGDGWQVLSLGLNKFTIKVISSDNHRYEEYEVEIFRKSPGSDASLEELTLREIENFEFSSTKYTYSVNVPWEITSITLYAKTRDPNSLIIQNKNNEYELKIELSVGNNQVVLNIEAEDGTILNYSIIIVRNARLNTDSSLQLLEIEGHERFDLSEQETEIKLFNLVVPYSVENIRVIASPTSPKSFVVGATTYRLNTGLNQVDVSCFAEDGSYTIYRIYVFREALSGNNFIEKITIAENENFVFHKETYSYVLFFKEYIDSLNLDITLSDPNAIYKVIGNSNFKDGVNTIDIEVTAVDGSIRTYTIFVNLEVKKFNPNIILISVLGVVNVGLVLVFILQRRKIRL